MCNSLPWSLRNVMDRMHYLPLLILAAVLVGAANASDVPSGDPNSGKRIFNRTCRVCHQVETGGGSSLGPNLAGVVGRAAPVDPSYDYSEAFRAAAEKGLVWDEATLDRFLAAPLELVPGSKMPMSVADAAKRRDLVAYLSTLKP